MESELLGFPKLFMTRHAGTCIPQTSAASLGVPGLGTLAHIWQLAASSLTAPDQGLLSELEYVNFLVLGKRDPNFRGTLEIVEWTRIALVPEIYDVGIYTHSDAPNPPWTHLFQRGLRDRRSAH